MREYMMIISDVERPGYERMPLSGKWRKTTFSCDEADEAFQEGSRVLYFAYDDSDFEFL